jgi:N-dimethylarginine dimethylaminohydrolase
MFSTPGSSVGTTTAPAGVERVATARRYLMCEPRYFTVEYTINPWMDPVVPTDTALAVRQWRSLVDTYLALGHTVDFIAPIDGLPDMVFAANGATVAHGRAYGARFRYAERVAEGPAYMDWLRDAGFDVHEPQQINEGEGDLLVAGDVLLAGTGFRSEQVSHAEAAEALGLTAVTLELVDPRYYHLDTALCVLSATEIAYFPGAFSASSRAVLEDRFPDAIKASADQAAVFGLNSVSDGRHVVLPALATELAAALRDRGFEPVPVDLTELHKSGGGPKCCTLELRA